MMTELKSNFEILLIKLKKRN